MSRYAGKTLLLLDDEENILASLRRLFRPLGCNILQYQDGNKALEFMADEAVDVVISDMRMPGMTGSEFLEEVANRWPSTIRILLTGYADIEPTIDAINRGKIFSYIKKPWDSDHVRIAVSQAFDLKQLTEDKEKLSVLIKRQNIELKKLNEELEEKVVARTEEIRQTAAFLEHTNIELQDTHAQAIRLLQELTVVSEPKKICGYTKKLIHLVGVIADECNLDKISRLTAIQSASLLYLGGRDCEQISLDGVCNSSRLVGILDSLSDVSKVIACRFERIDGTGGPKGLKGDEIPVEAGIVTAAADLLELKISGRGEKYLGKGGVTHYVESIAKNIYSPLIVKALNNLLRDNVLDLDALYEMRAFNQPHVQTPSVCSMSCGEIAPGMVLAEDLLGSQGILLLSKGHVLTTTLISRIVGLQKNAKAALIIRVEQ